MRVATIDIGTNSVLLLIAEKRPDGAVVAVVERAEITRLGKGVDLTGELSEETSDATLSCLREYAAIAKSQGAVSITAVGTSAMRDARGGPAFAARAAEILGSAPRIASGEEEARLTFAGALAGLPLRGALTVFDVGGGSTEIVGGNWDGASPRVDSAISLDIGSVRLTERHVKTDPPTAAELARVADDVDRALARATRPQPDSPLIGVAGTVTTIGALARSIAPYDGAKVHALELTKDEITSTLADLARRSLADRRKMPALDARRADVIVAGAVIVERVLAWSGARSVWVSDRGVRWGLALECLSSAASKQSVSGANFPS